MATTSPDSIAYPDASYTSGFVAAMAAMATSIQTALSKRGRKSYQWADATTRSAQTGMSTGDTGYQVDTAIVYRYNGSAWKTWESDWSSYTPTLSGVAIGAGGSATNTASYRYIAGQVKVRGVITLGSSGASVSATIDGTLPVTALALRHSYQQYPGGCTFYDTSAAQNYFAMATAANASVTDFNILIPGTNGLRAGTTATAPFTWSAGDSISYDFTYDPA